MSTWVDPDGEGTGVPITSEEAIGFLRNSGTGPLREVMNPVQLLLEGGPYGPFRNALISK